jgi:hypothetical protein
VETVQHNFPKAPRLSFIAAGIIGVLAVACPCASAASSRVQNISPAIPRLSAQFAVADFDGDQRPDFADVETGQGDSQNALYWIAFHLSSGPRRSLGVAAPAGGVEIAPLDVNADGYLDVVVTTHWTRRPVAVLLNDGRGNFRLSSPASFSQAFRLSNIPLDIRSSQPDFFSAALFFSGHDWNLSGFTTRINARSVILHNFHWNSGTPLRASFQHLPSRAPPSYSRQS